MSQYSTVQYSTTYVRYACYNTKMVIGHPYMCIIDIPDSQALTLGICVVPSAVVALCCVVVKHGSRPEKESLFTRNSPAGPQKCAVACIGAKRTCSNAVCTVSIVDGSVSPMEVLAWISR